MQTYGGVSVVNAIPSWYGSSMAVDLKVEVKVEEGEEIGEQSALVKTIVDYFRQKYNLPRLRVKITSEIPQMSGLKSSSAVSTALIGEISRKYGIDVDVPKLSAILSIKAGVSVTGALDDAVAAYYGGVSFTYNKEFKVIKKQSPPDGLVVLILARGNRQRVDLNSLKRYSALFQEIFKVALSDVITAMRLNGVAVAEILGYEKEPILEAMRTGALAYGVSGNGPSMFAVTKEGEEGPVYERLSKYGKVTITRAVDLESRD
ncbi:MAG: shikimate kinase [Candidatus Aramenus sulfurataquae]|jgi:shikimate kinase|uniref:Shikimate kinase n=3 Tax=Candidatus Aramenus sulfurataquae TaxID=1326980 RepID=W7KP19_9CREN|nr:MAG: shikimate kinase [Candidatus Aramenus sulfurataquae]MCL7344212.1 shikimate kinase [Candidatus Aramenus sulfurataquae]